MKTLTLSTAPEDRQLMAQDDDLKLPLTTTAGEHADEAAQKPVQQTHQHDAQSEPAGRDHQHALSAGIEFPFPTGSQMNAKTLWVFAITSAAVFMTTLDNLVVTSAIPVIRQDLDAGINGGSRESHRRRSSLCSQSESVPSVPGTRS